MELPSSLKSYIQNNVTDFDTIDSNRKDALAQAAEEIKALLREGQTAQLTFICTHNSRRSMFGQIWAKTAAYWYGIKNIETFSGGTEATAFNKRAVLAVDRAGFQIIKKDESANPLYQVSYSEHEEPIQCYSKVYDTEENPRKNFIAIMTCGHADENCPFIAGAVKRISLTYVDPKIADDTSEESATYDERCQQIATEMFFMMEKLG